MFNKNKNNINNIKRQEYNNYKNTPEGFRRLRMPRNTNYYNMYNKLKQPFFKSHHSNGGDFNYSMYFEYSLFNTILSYIFNILWSTKYLVIMAFILGIGFYSADMGIVELMNTGNFNATVLTFVFVTSIFAILRLNDVRTVKNVIIRLNSPKLYTILFNMTDNHATLANNRKEISVIKHYADLHSKLILFPTVKDLAAEEQLFAKWENKGSANKENIFANKDEILNKDLENLRVQEGYDEVLEMRELINLEGIKREHIAAKKYADLIQNQNGGTNEYDLMVKNYKSRTTPQIKEIIDSVQNSNVNSKKKIRTKRRVF